MQSLCSKQQLPCSPCMAAAPRQGLNGPSRIARRRRTSALARYDNDSVVFDSINTSAVYQPPPWHPQLFGLASSKRGQLERAVQTYYQQCWNNGEVELLRELAAPGIVYSDVFFGYDNFGVASLREMINEFQASHPLLRFDVEDVIVDEDRDTVVVHYTATAAHLLPSSGVPATGHVSTVQGMDKFRFDRFGHCTSIQCYRQRFADEEEVQLIDWDTV